MIFFFGFDPKDSYEQFPDDLHIVNEVKDSNDPAVRFQGGAFAAAGQFEDGK